MFWGRFVSWRFMTLQGRFVAFGDVSGTRRRTTAFCLKGNEKFKTGRLLLFPSEPGFSMGDAR